MRVSLLLHASWLVSIAHVTVQQPLSQCSICAYAPSQRTYYCNKQHNGGQEAPKYVQSICTRTLLLVPFYLPQGQGLGGATLELAAETATLTTEIGPKISNTKEGLTRNPLKALGTTPPKHG